MNLWRRRPAGVFALCADHENSRRDARATTTLRASLKIKIKIGGVSRNDYLPAGSAFGGGSF
jgi:hypothetical protein